MPTDQTDPVAVLRRYFPSGIGLRQVMVGEGSLAELMPAIAELERRQGREKRLEALVRGFLAVHDAIGATGELVEAARKEIENG